jgi:hypothetical protein
LNGGAMLINNDIAMMGTPENRKSSTSKINLAPLLIPDLQRPSSIHADNAKGEKTMPQ